MIGRIVNNYKIVSEIGHGGMGVVYKAYDSKLDRFVAIKILKGKPADPLNFIQRFKREAKNQAQLSHPNIVPVYDFLEADGMHGIVMEFIEGETLEHVIERKQRLDVYESIFIIKQVLKGLDFAHSKDFIHRDIKPSNIIISVDGVAKIMDFGISRSKNEKGHTETGKNIGTTFYMSPEQIKGENPTIESDIYSLGITLYEMLTGHVPFESQNEYDVFEGHLKKEPPDMLYYAPDLPSGIISIVHKALQKKPSKRYQSAKEFYSDIEEYEKGLIHGYSQKPIEKKNQTKKYKYKAIFYSTIILTAAAFVVYFITTQVITYWKNGKDFFALKGQDVTVLDSLPVVSSKQLDCEIFNSGINNTLNSISFINDSLAFICGNKGVILSTINGGRSWILQNSSTEKNLYSITFNMDGAGYAAGENSTLIKTQDFGQTWQQVTLPFTGHFFKVQFVNDFDIIITGDKGIILKSTDKGETWKRINSNTTALLYDFTFTNSKSAFAVGWDGQIIKTTDGGEYWEKLKPFTSNYLKSIKFTDQSSGFVAGGSGDLFYTMDEGKSWKRLNLDLHESFNDIQFIDNKIGFICGSKGKVLMTHDSGKTWIRNELKTFATLNDLAITPSGKIFAVGVNGTIIKL